MMVTLTLHVIYIEIVSGSMELWHSPSKHGRHSGKSGHFARGHFARAPSRHFARAISVVTALLLQMRIKRTTPSIIKLPST